MVVYQIRTNVYLLATLSTCGILIVPFPVMVVIVKYVEMRLHAWNEERGKYDRV